MTDNAALAAQKPTRRLSASKKRREPEEIEGETLSEKDKAFH